MIAWGSSGHTSTLVDGADQEREDPRVGSADLRQLGDHSFFIENNLS